MNRLDEIIEKIIAKGHQLNVPASLSEINQLEGLLNQKLPTEMKAFYLRTNGFDTLDFLFRFIPIEEIIEYKSELTKPNAIHIAEYLIYSDTWDLIMEISHSEKYKIVNSNHNSEPNKTLSNSFFDFLEQYLEGDGVLGENGLYS